MSRWEVDWQLLLPSWHAWHGSTIALCSSSSSSSTRCRLAVAPARRVHRVQGWPWDATLQLHASHLCWSLSKSVKLPNSALPLVRAGDSAKLVTLLVGLSCRPLKQQPSRDHLGPLLVPAGSDSFSSIGLPHSSSSRSWDPASLAAGQQQWLEAVALVWPSGSGAGSAKAAAAGGPKQPQSQQQQQPKGEGGHGSSAVAFTATYQEEGTARSLVWR